MRLTNPHINRRVDVSSRATLITFATAAGTPVGVRVFIRIGWLVTWRIIVIIIFWRWWWRRRRRMTGRRTPSVGRWTMGAVAKRRRSRTVAIKRRVPFKRRWTMTALVIIIILKLWRMMGRRMMSRWSWRSPTTVETSVRPGRTLTMIGWRRRRRWTVVVIVVIIVIILIIIPVVLLTLVVLWPTIEHCLTAKDFVMVTLTITGFGICNSFFCNWNVLNTINIPETEKSNYWKEESDKSCLCTPILRSIYSR